MRETLLLFFTHPFKKKTKMNGEQRGSASTGPLFFECISLSGVSFGWFVPVKGHYLWTLNTGKSLQQQKDNSGRRPRSESRGKALDASTAATPLRPPSSSSPWSIVVPLPQVDHLHTVIQTDFPKDTTKECQGQVWARHPVNHWMSFTSLSCSCSIGVLGWLYPFCTCIFICLSTKILSKMEPWNMWTAIN